MPNDLRTKAIVLRRINYGEYDRILNLLSPEGNFSVLAKGVRKEKSRLAGGIEPFLISDVVIHQSRSAGLGILTGARMLNSFHNILNDLERLELASKILRQLEHASEQINSPEHFSLLSQSLSGLHHSFELETVLTWFLLNLTRISGEEINLYRDTEGQTLDPKIRYNWDITEKAFRPHLHGAFSANEIKILRLMLSNSLAFNAKINQLEQFLPPILAMAKTLSP